MTHSEFPFRQVHLDFHTSPDIPDVGADWDADHFVQTLKRGHVNSVTLFATCHHGMCYYPSTVAPVHPALTFDLLGQQIEACHRAGIRCPIYLTVAWNVSASQRHPEWRQIDIHGKQVGALPLEAGWPWMCVNAAGTAYTEELLAQTQELLDRYGDDCDGFFYDIVMYHADGCLCHDCLRALRDSGLDPTDMVHRRRNNVASAHRFMERASRLVNSQRPQAGIFYNSRWGLQFAEEAQYYSQIEVESLPTGGWGYGFYPLWSRFARTFDLPLLGMTGRFHRSWADWGGLKHPEALKFECGGILATGGAVSVGDQLHPRGKLNEAVYDVIGEAFRAVEELEPYCRGARAQGCTQIGLLVLKGTPGKANPTDANGIVAASAISVEGAAKILLELQEQFDVITEKTCPDFRHYDLLLLPDYADMTPSVLERLKAYVAGGGKLLVSHEALLDRENNVFYLADEFGLDYIGPAGSNPDYFQVTAPDMLGPVVRSGFPYSFYEGPASRTYVRPGTETLADAYETYFNRTGEHFSSHGYTPPIANKADYPAITVKADCLYIYGPIFGAYHRYGNLTFREVVGRCLDRLLPTRIVSTTAPPTTEVSLLHQEAEQRYILHLVNYHPQRRATGHVEVLEAPIPLHDVRVTLRVPESIQRAFLAPSGAELPLMPQGDTVTVVVPHVAAHAVIVFEENK